LELKKSPHLFLRHHDHRPRLAGADSGYPSRMTPGSTGSTPTLWYGRIWRLDYWVHKRGIIDESHLRQGVRIW